MQKLTPGPWRTAGVSNPGTDQARQWIWGPTAPGDQSGHCVCRDVTLPDAKLICMAHGLLEFVKSCAEDRSDTVSPGRKEQAQRLIARLGDDL